MKAPTNRIFVTCLLILSMLGASFAAAAEQKSEENLLARIYMETRNERILERHASFSFTETSDDYHLTYYTDGQVSVNDWRIDKGFMRVRTNDFVACLFDNGTVSRWVNFETNKSDWEGLSESMLLETILSVETKEGAIILTTQPCEEERLRIIGDEYADVENKEQIQMRVVYVLSEETLELQSITDYDTMPDGREILAWELHLDYDAELPYEEQIGLLNTHYADAKGTRTTTFIFDEGTRNECTYVFETPIGDNCVIPETITKDGIRYTIDRDRSVMTNEARDNDAVIYLLRESAS